jgi:hypothetical protein
MISAAALGGRPRAGSGHPVRASSIARQATRPNQGGHGYDQPNHGNGRKRHLLVDT